MPLPKAVQDLLCRCRGRRSRSPSPGTASPGTGAELTAEYTPKASAFTVPDDTTADSSKTPVSTVSDAKTADSSTTPVSTVPDVMTADNSSTHVSTLSDVTTADSSKAHFSTVSDSSKESERERQELRQMVMELLREVKKGGDPPQSQAPQGVVVQETQTELRELKQMVAELLREAKKAGDPPQSQAPYGLCVQETQAELRELKQMVAKLLREAKKGGDPPQSQAPQDVGVRESERELQELRQMVAELLREVRSLKDEIQGKKESADPSHTPVPQSVDSDVHTKRGAADTPQKPVPQSGKSGSHTKRGVVDPPQKPIPHSGEGGSHTQASKPQPRVMSSRNRNSSNSNSSNSNCNSATKAEPGPQDSSVTPLSLGYDVTAAADPNAEFLDAWFPALQTESYVIPTVHFRTVHAFDKKMRGGGEYKELKDEKEINKPGQYENNYDRGAKNVMALEDILGKLHKSMNVIRTNSPKDVMVMMTQTNSGLYKSVYAGAADMNSNAASSRAGKIAEGLKTDLASDLADLVVVERDRGVLIGAVVRNNGADLDDFRYDLDRAIEYLNQAHAIVDKWVISEVEGGSMIPVHATLLLPNMARDCFAAEAKRVKTELEDCLGVDGKSDVTQHCLCEDDMDYGPRLMQWWKTCRGQKVPMENNVYRDLVYRFAVPLLTVKLFLGTEPRLQLWTKGHVVHALGEEYGRDWTRLALFPEQSRILQEHPEDEEEDHDVILLNGPPGTSKTFLLMLRASHWLKLYKPVVAIAQTTENGLAASLLIKHQLEKVAEKIGGGVKMIDLSDVWKDGQKLSKEGKKKLDAWLEDLCRGAVDGAVHLLADEAHAELVGLIYGKLQDKAMVVRMWAAGVQLTIPDNMKEKVRLLREPLRCPRAVTEEIQLSDQIKAGRVLDYSELSVTRAYDGVPTFVIEVDGKVDSEEGGRAVGEYFVNTLRVGVCSPGGWRGLRHKDMLVLGFSDRATDYAAVARGLEAEGVPARCDPRQHDEEGKVTSAWRDWVEGLATGGGEDAVTVGKYDTVTGLERPVVVWLDQGEYGTDYKGRLDGMSRATAHLVIVRRK